MKKSDLYREWARVLDMCEGTEVHPGYCWGYDGLKNLLRAYPNLDKDIDKYFFAVAIVEDKPVFVGDTLYYIPTGIPCIVEDKSFIKEKMFSWNPPKKTFMLNDVELPCATNDKAKSRLTIYCKFSDIQIGVGCFNFDGEMDSKKVFDVLVKILSENTKF